MAATLNKTEDEITREVVDQYERTPDPRLQRIMTALVRHVHEFAREVELTEREWFKAIDYMTRTGQMCSDTRQEFILLSDVLGVSMLVDLINHRKPAGLTESTVLGPFFAHSAPGRRARMASTTSKSPRRPSRTCAAVSAASPTARFSSVRCDR